MKKKSILLSIAIMLLAINLEACAENKNGQRASGKIIVKNYDVVEFNKIKSQTVSNITYTQGDEVSLRAEGTESEIENLEVSFKDGELKLESKIKDKKGKNNLKLYITSPNLYKIDHEGVGTFTLKDKVSVDELEIEYEGVGSLVADNLECENLKVEFEGVGNMKLIGFAKNAKFKSEGVGNMDAKDFKVDHLTVKASGVGSIKCYASKTIDISSDGVGGVTYWGSAEVKRIEKSGIGKVKSAE